jgi:hypothetical protein
MINIGPAHTAVASRDFSGQNRPQKIAEHPIPSTLLPDRHQVNNCRLSPRKSHHSGPETQCCFQSCAQIPHEFSANELDKFLILTTLKLAKVARSFFFCAALTRRKLGVFTRLFDAKFVSLALVTAVDAAVRIIRLTLSGAEPKGFDLQIFQNFQSYFEKFVTPDTCDLF